MLCLLKCGRAGNGQCKTFAMKKKKKREYKQHWNRLLHNDKALFGINLYWYLEGLAIDEDQIFVLCHTQEYIETMPFDPWTVWRPFDCHGPLARYAKLRVRMLRECRERFPATEGKRSWHASRHVRDARAVMHAGIANYRFLLKSAVGGNVPGIPGACASRNFMHLVRGPWTDFMAGMDK